MRKKILVLGGGGFIGGHLVKKLVERNDWVRVVDLKPHKYGADPSEFIQGDLTDAEFCKTIILTENGNSFDEIYQLAADMGGAGYIFSGENDAHLMTNSVRINLNVLNSVVNLKDKSVKTKIFYSSSACIYPEEKQLSINNLGLTETDAYPANPDSEYGWEKLFSERLFQAYHRNYGLNIRIARFHNVYGPEGSWNNGREKSPAAICRKVALARSNDSIEIWGDGLQTRSFLYIEDCLNAVIKLMESEYKMPLNIGSAEMVSINELVNLAAGFENKNIKIINLDGPLGVRSRSSNNKLMKEVLKYNYKTSLSDGLKTTYFWILNQIQNGVLDQ